jgi:glutathione synthase
MERVFPAPTPTWFVRAGRGVAALPAVSELGVYSVWLADGGPPLLNRAAGHLLRTKVDGTDEGGVAAGFAVLDSPLLTDE